MIEIILLLLASSLHDLENQVIGTDAYRTELIGYITEHNIVAGVEENGEFSGIIGNNQTWRSLGDVKVTADMLEQTVREHMLGCQTVSKGAIISLNVLDVLLRGVC